jgi:hypothetical protein
MVGSLLFDRHWGLSRRDADKTGRPALIRLRHWLVESQNAKARNTRVSIGFNIGHLDHLAPFLNLIADELAVLSRCERQGNAAELGKPFFDRRIGEAGINFAVKFVENFGGRIFWVRRGRKANSPRSPATILPRSECRARHLTGLPWSPRAPAACQS